MKRKIFDDSSLCLFLKPMIADCIKTFQNIEKDFHKAIDGSQSDDKERALLLAQLEGDIERASEQAEKLLLQTSEHQGGKGNMFHKLLENAIHDCASQGLIDADEFNLNGYHPDYTGALEALEKGYEPVGTYESDDEKMRDHGHKNSDF